MSEVVDKKETPVRPDHATEMQDFIPHLDGGLFERKLGIALSEVAAAVVDHAATGEVTVKFKLKQIAGSAAVVVAHQLSTKQPTSKGDRSENDTTSTPMYIGPGGKMSIYPMGADTKDMFSND